MFWPTHVQIARLIRMNLIARHDVKLNFQGFAYGNIRPDIQPDYYYDGTTKKKVEHFAHLALDFIAPRLEQLMHHHLDETAFSSKAFALELGHIVHYFSDFFCHAHSPRFSGNLRQHFQYEYAFGRYFDGHFNQLKAAGPKIDGSIHCSYQALMADFKRLQRAYLNGPISFAHDAEYTLTFNTMLCHSVIAACYPTTLSDIA